MTGETFNLVDEPWIEALRLDGTPTTVSIRGVFAEAHELRGLSGEVVTQPVAVLRLLLAILYRTVAVEGYPEDAWQSLWQRGELDLAPIRQHLDAHRERFDLLHPETPFYQVADLHTARGEYTSLSRLIADVPPKDQYFTTRTADSYQRISRAEAARWLVHAQAFDPSGIKSGAVGDERVKGGRGYPIGTAWAGSLGLVILEGDNLFQTLLLNLDLSCHTPRDSAVWERAPQGPTVEERSAAGPVGPADLLTWQSRRIRLFTDSSAVVGVLLANGDPLHARNRHALERMSAWRRSANQQKQTGLAKVLMPRVHDADRKLWRGLSGMFSISPGGQPLEGEPPGVLTWLGRLVGAEVVPKEFPVRARAVGVEYGSQSAVIVNLYDDALVLRSLVMEEPRLKTLAVDAVDDAEKAVRHLGDLAGNLSAAAGGDPSPARTETLAVAYDALEEPYLAWLRRLDVRVDPEQERRSWQRSVFAGISARGEDLIRAAGVPAWVGRTVRRGSSERYLNTALAERYFRAALRRDLPGAFATEIEERTGA